MLLLQLAVHRGTLSPVSKTILLSADGSDRRRSSLAASSVRSLGSGVLQVDQAAAGLLALGLKKGDRLGMWGPNHYEWVLMQFATAQAGIVLVRSLRCLGAWQSVGKGDGDKLQEILESEACCPFFHALIQRVGYS